MSAPVLAVSRSGQAAPRAPALGKCWGPAERPGTGDTMCSWLGVSGTGDRSLFVRPKKGRRGESSKANHTNLKCHHSLPHSLVPVGKEPRGSVAGNVASHVPLTVSIGEGSRRQKELCKRSFCKGKVNEGWEDTAKEGPLGSQFRPPWVSFLGGSPCNLACVRCSQAKSSPTCLQGLRILRTFSKVHFPTCLTQVGIFTSLCKKSAGRVTVWLGV